MTKQSLLLSQVPPTVDGARVRLRSGDARGALAMAQPLRVRLGGLVESGTLAPSPEMQKALVDLDAVIDPARMSWPVSVAQVGAPFSPRVAAPRSPATETP